MLIFDRFPDETKARAFMAAITEQFKLKTYLCRNESGYLFDVKYKPDKTLADIQEETKAQWVKDGFNGEIDASLVHPDGVLDTFPFALTDPIVCVERPRSPFEDAKTTKELEVLAAKVFADPNPGVEDLITERVEEYGGVFAGT